MKHEIKIAGETQSFSGDHALVAASSAGADVLILAGADARLPDDAGRYTAVAIELGTECLEVYTGENGPANVFGFARWKLGDLPASDLVEVVKPEGASESALAALRAVFEGAGLEVSVCADRAGRIIDRLIRPQFNIALAAIDDGLAPAVDMDECLRLGLGYRKGVVAPLLASGLEHHYGVTKSLFETYGLSQYAPPRRAVVAHQRRRKA